eukprot:SAG31_NODE_12509_length_936_cov_1.407407_2_plen_33_part_01
MYLCGWYVVRGEAQLRGKFSAAEGALVIFYSSP